jgi:pectate lyase
MTGVQRRWQVDRFDGLFDCEDGTDNVTFSHNIIRNHHKSMLLGGGTKEAPRDLGKMHFTVFGNLFNGSASRNPLMRFGTFDVTGNVFLQRNDRAPVFDLAAVSSTHGTRTLRGRANGPADAVFEYNLGVYNQSTVVVRDNVFIQTGVYANDPSRTFTFSEDTSADTPARLCIPVTDSSSTLNGAVVNMTRVGAETIRYTVTAGKAIKDGVLLTCDNVDVGYELPHMFKVASDVKQYVLQEAGQN